MKTTLKFPALIAFCGALCVAFVHGVENPKVDCVKLSFEIKEEVAANQSLVLQIVEKAVLANRDCACEIVKSAITATRADNKLIASIVEVAAVTAPEKMYLVALCAVAVAPDSSVDVQAVLAKLDPGTGEGGTSGMEVKPARSKDPKYLFMRKNFQAPFFLSQPCKNDVTPATRNNINSFVS